MDRNTTTIRDYLRIIFRRKMLLAVTIIPVLIINYIMLEFQTETYTASVKMLIKSEELAPSERYQRVPGLDLARSYTEVVNSKRVVRPVVKALELYKLPETREFQYASTVKKVWLKYIYAKLGLEIGRAPTLAGDRKEDLMDRSISEWTGKISTKHEPGSYVFTIDVRDYDPSLASKVANAISRSYLIFDLEQQIAELELKYGDKHSSIVQMRNMVQKMTDALDSPVVPGIETIPTSVKILEGAQIIQPERKSKTMVLVFSMFAGLMLGITLIVLLDYFNQTVNSPKDVKDVLHSDLLGSVPKIKAENKLINSSNVSADYIGAYKQLSDNIYLKMRDQQLKSILITDSDDSQDTPYIVANIAMYLSQYEGHKVLLVDLNLRSQALSETFSISSNGNLIDVLEERIPFEDAVNDIGSNLHILPASKPAVNPIGFLESNNLTGLINSVRDNYDLIIMYCADLQNYKDAIILSSYADCTIIVMNEGKTHKRVSKYLIQPLQQKKVNLIGTILNNRSYDIPNILYKLT